MADCSKCSTPIVNVCRTCGASTAQNDYGYSQKTVDALTKERDTLRIILAELEARNERKTDALWKIQTWAKAYPLDIFLKPDLKKAHEVLKAAGMTLDAISADTMRHVLDGVKDIVNTALQGES